MEQVTHNSGIRDTFLVFGAPAIESPEIEEVVATLKSGWLGTGPKVEHFESLFREYKGTGEAIAVSSGTAALHLSAIAAGIGPGDEVITTALTFCATVNAIIHAGGTPVIVDVDPDTMNIDPAAAKHAITPRTRALLPVHFAGRPCDMDAIVTIARDHDLIIIEDCAHAIETEYHGRPAGTFGDFGCFSFYVTKNVVTGEGGMVLARNGHQAQQIRSLGLHGLTKDAWKRFQSTQYEHYYVVAPGYKYNMSDMQAAIGLHQLKRVESLWERRQAIWKRYNVELAGLPLILPKDVELDARHAYHLYTVLLEEQEAGMSRDEFLNRMTSRLIGVSVHYMCLAEHPYYQRTYGWRPEETPNAFRIGRHTISLPLSARLTDEDVGDVIYAVRESILQGKC